MSNSATEPGGRVALITGATRGIGLAVATSLAASGYSIAVHGRDVERAEKIAATLAESFDVAAFAVSGDIADPAAVSAMMRPVFDRFRRLDALVINAGTHAAAPLGMMEEATIERLFAVNSIGATHTLNAALKLLRRGQSPAVVLVASVMGRRGGSGQVVYAATKAAVAGLTIAAAKELGPAGIRVNAVAPGYIATDMLASLDDAGREARIAATPLGRLGEAEDVAEAVAFLLSDRARFITGQVLGVDGGLVI